EAELGLTLGVFGRAAKGGGGFVPLGSDASGRERARRRRRQLRRESSLGRVDRDKQDDMVTSERLAAVCDLFWRRRQGQQPDASRPAPSDRLSAEDRERVERVVQRLDALAPLWSKLSPGGGSCSFGRASCRSEL